MGWGVGALMIGKAVSQPPFLISPKQRLRWGEVRSQQWVGCGT